MRWPVDVTHVFVCARSSVGVAHEQRDGGAQRDALEQPREDLDPISLVALRHQSALPGAAPIEIMLDLVGGEGQARGTAVDDDTDATTVRFAECGNAKDRAEGAGHVGPAANDRPQAGG